MPSTPHEAHITHVACAHLCEEVVTSRDSAQACVLSFPSDSRSMPSAVEVAKRELVKVLRELAAKYRLSFSLTRESRDGDVAKAFKRVSLKAHPDKGGDLQDFQRLSSTNDVWTDLLKAAGAAGRPSQPQQRKEKPKAGQPWAMSVPEEKKEFAVRSTAVLLTYQSFSEDLFVFLPTWERFVSLVEASAQEWGIKFWTATAETNEDAKHHFHLMVHFRAASDTRVSSMYAFEGVLPNASCNDLLGESFGGHRCYPSFLCLGGPPAAQPLHWPPLPVKPSVVRCRHRPTPPRHSPAVEVSSRPLQTHRPTYHHSPHAATRPCRRSARDQCAPCRRWWEEQHKKGELWYQTSVDRGQFYCWANKKGTVVNAEGKPCRAGMRGSGGIF